ncbi:MAG TPA: PAS domain-containing protein [Thermotogota bacterium]|nr:PAS domain-containing protein [Thermotogota bacterium]
MAHEDVKLRKSRAFRRLQARNRHLKEFRERGLFFFESVEQGLLLINQRREIIRINSSGKRILGVSAGEAAERKVFDTRWVLIDGKGRRVPAEEFPSEVALRTGNEVKGQVFRVWNDPQKRFLWIRISAYPHFHFRRKAPHEVLVFFEDVSELYDSQQSLHRVSQKLDQLESAGTLGTWEWDMENHLLAFSENARLIFGFSPDQSLNEKDFLQRIDPLDVADMYREIGQLLENPDKKQSLSFLLRVYSPKQGEKQVKLTCDLLLDSSGKKMRMGGVLQDVTTQEKIQRELEESKVRFAGLVESLPEVVWEVGPTGHVQYISPPVEELLGIPPDAFLGLPPWKPLPERSQKGIRELLEPRFRKAKAFSLELSLHNRENRLVHLDCIAQPFFNAKGVFQGHRGILRDMTAIREMEEQLRRLNHELEQRVDEKTQRLEETYAELLKTKKGLELVLWAANEGYWDWDYQNDTIYYDENWYRILGYSSSDFSSPSEIWTNLVHPLDRDRSLADLQRHLDGLEEVYETEYRLRAKNGSWIWVLDKGKVVERTPEGDAARIVGIHIDITTRKVMEAQLDLARERAEIANQSKNEFISNINHELRTPLTIIMGMTETLLEEEENPGPEVADRKYFLETTFEYSKHLLTLINDIIELSKLDAGRLGIELTDVNLQRLLRTIRRGTQQLASQKNVQFRFSQAKDVPEIIEADEARLSQLLNNLLGNAVKFTDKGAVDFRVSVCNQEDAITTLRFEVQDTGIGIPSEFQAKIFERFFQVERGNHRKFGGTGLGLAITKELVERMGGSIRLESQEGKGSCFTVDIPFRIPVSEDEEGEQP